MNSLLPAPNLQLTQNKALHFFYSIQMSGYKPIVANHLSRLLASLAAALNLTLPAFT
jgi:hypothetical protein